MLRLSLFLLGLAVIASAVQFKGVNTNQRTYQLSEDTKTVVRNEPLPPSGKPSRPFQRAKAADPDYSAIMQQLWALDINAMNASTMVLDLQEPTTTTSKNDNCPLNLFKYVNTEFLLSRPTVTTMLALMDNYIYQLGISEQDTVEEATEIQAFLDAICDTDVMRATLEYLQAEGYAFSDMESFKVYLKEIWFTSYPRSKNWANPIDTSGFEHVFLGEVKKDKSVGGLHNWIVAYFYEQTGRMDYTGYINGYSTFPPGRVIFGAKLWAFDTNWKSPFSSFIFGSSPEFDVATFTICFLTRPNKVCAFTLDNQAVSLKALKFSNYVDTAYPDVTYTSG